VNSLTPHDLIRRWLSHFAGRYPELDRDEPAFHLVEATGRILPEVTDRPGRWVVRELERRVRTST